MHSSAYKRGEKCGFEVSSQAGHGKLPRIWSALQAALPRLRCFVAHNNLLLTTAGNPRPSSLLGPRVHLSFATPGAHTNFSALQLAVQLTHCRRQEGNRSGSWIGRGVTCWAVAGDGADLAGSARTAAWAANLPGGCCRCGRSTCLQYMLEHMAQSTQVCIPRRQMAGASRSAPAAYNLFGHSSPQSRRDGIAAHGFHSRLEFLSQSSAQQL